MLNLHIQCTAENIELTLNIMEIIFSYHQLNTTARTQTLIEFIISLLKWNTHSQQHSNSTLCCRLCPYFHTNLSYPSVFLLTMMIRRETATSQGRGFAPPLSFLFNYSCWSEMMTNILFVRAIFSVILSIDVKLNINILRFMFWIFIVLTLLTL